MRVVLLEVLALLVAMEIVLYFQALLLLEVVVVEITQVLLLVQMVVLAVAVLRHKTQGLLAVLHLHLDKEMLVAQVLLQVM